MKNNNTDASITWNHPHFWWDSFLLLIIWLAVFFLPEHIYKVPVAIILKVVALVASLEMISFLAYQFVDKKNGLFLQGFLGGFASSTTVFVQITQDKRFSKLSVNTITSILLFATLAMLIETLIIGLGLDADQKIVYMIVFQMIVTALFIYLLWRDHESSKATDVHFYIDHPIIWKRVLKLALFILTLIGVMKLITAYAPISEPFAVLLTSFFEAHAVFVAILLKDHQSNIYFLYLLVSLGSVLSKLFLVWRSKIPGLVRQIVLPLAISIAGIAIIAFV